MPTGTIDRDDHDLAVRFRDGDPDAIREVYRLYSGSMYALSRSLLADREHAKDAVQQTFLQAWRAAARFDPDRSLAAWLHQICRRVCIDRYRRERKAAAAVTTNGSVGDLPTEGPSMEQTWTTWEVRRAIDELPALEREIVRLAHLEGWSFTQIAERLDVPVGTVKSRSHRAHRRLASSLAHMAPTADEELVA
jgi:RNA polymerase sigma-70 factor (ECF subfamily)